MARLSDHRPGSSRRRSCRRLRDPAADARDGAVAGDQPGRQASCGQPRRCVVAEDDGRGARGVGGQAGRGGDGHRAPGTDRRQPGARVEQVVALGAVDGPPPREGGGGGDAAVVRRQRPRVVVVGPLGQRGAPTRPPPTAATSPPMETRTGEPVTRFDCGRCPVGGQGLRGGAQVERETDGDEQQVAVEVHVAPAVARAVGRGVPGPGRLTAYDLDVPVVAERRDVASQRGVDEPVGEPRPPESAAATASARRGDTWCSRPGAALT